jgi:ribonucleotide reductase beta subunit family protein with ferritin-like domain
MKKKFDSKYYTHLSPHDKWVLKSLISTVEMLDKVVTETKKMKKEIDEIKNPRVEDMFNMKRGDPFKEGTD